MESGRCNVKNFWVSAILIKTGFERMTLSRTTRQILHPCRRIKISISMLNESPISRYISRSVFDNILAVRYEWLFWDSWPLYMALNRYFLFIGLNNTHEWLPVSFALSEWIEYALGQDEWHRNTLLVNLYRSKKSTFCSFDSWSTADP